MAPMARRNHSNLRVVLNERYGKHGEGNEGIILCRDDKGGDSDSFKNTACTCTFVVVGSAGVPSVRGGVPVVEFAHSGDAIEFRKIPLAGNQRGLSAQPCFQAYEKVSVIHPVARPLQSFDAFRGVNVWTDRDRAD